MNERILNSPEARYRLMRLERERERKAKNARDRLLGLDGKDIADVIMGTKKTGTIKVNMSADVSKFQEALRRAPIKAKPADTPFWQTFKPYKRESY